MESADVRRRRRPWLSPLFTSSRAPARCRLLGNCSPLLVASLLLWLQAPGSTSDEYFSSHLLLSSTVHEQSLGLNDTLDASIIKKQDKTVNASSMQSTLQSSLKLEEEIHLNFEETTTQVKDISWSGKFVLSDDLESSAAYNSLDMVPLSQSFTTVITKEFQPTMPLPSITAVSSVSSSFLRNKATSQLSDLFISSTFFSSSNLVHSVSFLAKSAMPILPPSEQSSQVVSSFFSSFLVSNHGTWQSTVITTPTNWNSLDFLEEYSETALLNYIDVASNRTKSPVNYTEGENELFPISNGIALLNSTGKFEIIGESTIDQVETFHIALTPELVSTSSTSALPPLETSDAASSEKNSINYGVMLTEFNRSMLSIHSFSSPSTHGAISSSHGLSQTQLFDNDFGSGDNPEMTTLSISKTAEFVPNSNLIFDSFDPDLLESQVYNTYFLTRAVPTVSTKFTAWPVPLLISSSLNTINPPTTHSLNQKLFSSIEDNLVISSVTPSVLISETPVLVPTVNENFSFIVADMNLKPTVSLKANISYPPQVTSYLTNFIATDSLKPTSGLDSSMDFVSSLRSVLSMESGSVLSTEYSSLFEQQIETPTMFETVSPGTLFSILTQESTLIEPEPTASDLLVENSNSTNLVIILESSFSKSYSSSTFERTSFFEASSLSVDEVQPTLIPSTYESIFTANSTTIADHTTESLEHSLPNVTLVSSSLMSSTIATTADPLIILNSTVEMPFSYFPTSTAHVFPDVLPSTTETSWISASLLLTPPPPSTGNSSNPNPVETLPATTIAIPVHNLTATPNSDITTAVSSNTGSKPPFPMTTQTTVSATTKNFVCDVNELDSYLVRAVLSDKVTSLQDVLTPLKDVLSQLFKRDVELQVFQPNQEFMFMVTAGPVVFSAPAVLNALSQSTLVSGTSPLILSLQPALTSPDHQAQVQIVLQFVPRYVDVRFCNFTQRIERGLTMAFAEVRRRQHETEGFVIQIINVTHTVQNFGGLRQSPVNITFAINSQRGFLNGSDVSDLLRILNLVEFSFYLGFPVFKTAEPIYYPELNRSYLLMASWIKTVLLGVHDNHIQDKTFQAELERKLAQLICEATGSARRWKRASTLGNNTVQVVNITKIIGDGSPAELIYFVEKQNGERLNANEAANLINKVDIQRAAIVLGYQIQGALAQPVERVPTSSPTDENRSMWIIVAVLVPVIVVIIIIMILYWKFCRTDKLEFQPDTMSNIQQRQKLQVPSVKGFDFAKQHIGQHGKDDILVIHEGLPPVSAKDNSPSENGDVSSPQPKTAKLSKGLRQRSRVSPSEAESTASEQSSDRESVEDIPRAPAIPSGNKHMTIRNEAHQTDKPDEQPSSASIFDHVDRMSRPSETGKWLPNKIQLIAMQPIPAPPLQNPLLPERVAETNKINKEVQRALRQKSEIEHHRNKIRLRAKRKGHYDFPIMDEVGTIEAKERRRVYRRAQVHIDRILDPSADVPVELRKSYRGKRSPRQRRRHQVNGSMTDAEKDRLITTDSDGTYKKPPGVNNAAYVSDPDLPPEPRPHSPSHTHPPPPAPPPYLPPQPSIEEARQQMYSLLDDAFALAAPGSPGKVLSAVSHGQPTTSTPIRGTKVSANNHWTPVYEQPQSLSNPYVTRYEDTGSNQPSAASHLHSSGYMRPGEEMRQEQSQQEILYSNRPMYADEFQTRPPGNNPGVHVYPLSQSRVDGKVTAQPGQMRGGRPGPQGVVGWTPYGNEDGLVHQAHSREQPSTRAHLEYVSPLYPMQRTSLRDPSAPSLHLQHCNAQEPSEGFRSSCTEELVSGQSSTSLIKAIREELLRLSQKQSAFQNMHS
ncbi:UPF0606 protein KIAA1549-like isoform X2 [Hypanus sabinus]|uniref:UPF0606 protein KIAA1549-like isoform X2 n=1 Tax=Hypanus sabinus TaxID=79690 RepID=UPI0028C4D0A7|nr:UPF0606 protein KIAA1549-like isoform X2 [Hypanus sabinus]